MLFLPNAAVSGLRATEIILKISPVNLYFKRKNSDLI